MRPGADEGYAAAVAAERGDPVADRVASARAAARRSGSGAAASTRSRAGSASRRARCDDAHGRGARGGERGRRRDRRRRPRARRVRPRRPVRRAFPVDRAVRGDRRQHDARRGRDRRPARQGRVPSASRRARTTASPGRCDPAHTRFDGDLAIALATGAVEANLDRVRSGRPPTSSAEAVRGAPG